MNCTIEPIRWEEDLLLLLDQRYLPHEESLVKVDNLEACHRAINEMVVRGAPCIGFTALFGIVLWIKNQTWEKTDSSNLSQFKDAARYLKTARPTAVNLAFEIDRVVNLLEKDWSVSSRQDLYDKALIFAKYQMELAYESNLSMAKFCLDDITGNNPKGKYNFMTHCNTGHLACGCLGTALGVISYASTVNKVNHVWVDETRPYMQGARLTSYELVKQNISHQVVVEGAASYLMREGKVDAIVVGADRIANNGDTANKIGTSTLAIVANYYNVPFYVIAPTSSFDLSLASGLEIPIELRNSEEILKFKNIPVAPTEAEALNPSFDITPASLISGIVCEKGLITPPFDKNVSKVVNL